MSIKDTLLHALAQYRGDDLERAQCAFRGLAPQAMEELHGQSGRTRQQIIDDYAAHVATVERAVAWVKEYAP